MDRKRVTVALILIVTVAGIVIIFSAFLPKETPVKVKLWGVVLDLELPENSNENGQNFRVGTAQLTFPEDSTQSEDLVHEIFDQYVGFLENSSQTDGKIAYTLWVRAIGEDWLLEHGIPPIRQDNIGENFCFYVERTVIKPLHPQRENGKLTVILPEGYEITSSTAQTEFVDNRWRATAYTTEYGDLYIAIYYRKVS